MTNIHYKKHISYLIVALFMIAFVPSRVNADTDNNGHSDDKDVAHAVEVPDEALTDEQRAEKRAERIEKNKAALQEKLEANEQERISSRCKNAQKLISTHSARFEKLKENRTRVYSDVAEKLEKLTERLELAGADTAQLKIMLTELDTMTHAFLELGIDHDRSLADLEEMDCEADPEAFKATLEAVRAEWTAMHEEAKSIRAYIVETIKPELLRLKGTIAVAEDDSTENSETTENETEGTN